MAVSEAPGAGQGVSWQPATFQDICSRNEELAQRSLSPVNPCSSPATPQGPCLTDSAFAGMLGAAATLTRAQPLPPWPTAGQGRESMSGRASLGGCCCLPSISSAHCWASSTSRSTQLERVCVLTLSWAPVLTCSPFHLFCPLCPFFASSCLRLPAKNPKPC